MSRESTATGGIGICTVLLLIFVTLKLTGLIDWSWLWVLSPLWIPIALAIILISGAVLIIGLISIFSGEDD